jgi:hypothetical protein
VLIAGSSAGQVDQSGGANPVNKDGAPSNNDISTSTNNSNQQGPKGQREQRPRFSRAPQNSKPKEAMVNGTSG